MKPKVFKTLVGAKKFQKNSLYEIYIFKVSDAEFHCVSAAIKSRYKTPAL
jgi:hypothetical protein